MSKFRLTQPNDPLDGRIIYLLVMTTLVQFLFPLSISDNVAIVIAYQIFYMSLFVTGIYLVSNNPIQFRVLVVATVIWAIAATTYSFRRDLQWANVVGYFVFMIFQGLLTFVLLRYIFRARVVSLDVLLAACTVYLLIGAIFVPIYGVIETFTYFPDEINHAFSDGAFDYAGEAIPWQTFVYYSYATLSTLGYGDILPITPWARSAATFEAVIGVLYTAVIVARLVGLYATTEIEQELIEEIAEHESQS